ncbi:hypothetical protein Dimus_033280, partial [Dionaea muscipula]
DEAAKDVKEEVVKIIEATTTATSADKAPQVSVDEATATADVNEASEAVDEEKIPKSIKANTDYLEATLEEVVEDPRTRFELMETKLKMTELDLNINFNMKIDKDEANLTRHIGENSSRLTTVEETLASLLKAQQE